MSDAEGEGVALPEPAPAPAGEADVPPHGESQAAPEGEGQPSQEGENQSPPEGKNNIEEMVRLAEALVFASTAPVSARALTQALPDGADADAVIAALRARYVGRGVELADIAGGLQFRTAPDLGPRLKRVVQVPRRLPRVAMETLAIVAYHQPVTRPEIEEIRGAALAQNTLDALLEAGLITPRGRKETPGRPTLWGTTPEFLAQFGLRDLRELPRREDLLVETPSPPTQAPPASAESGAEETVPEESAAEETGVQEDGAGEAGAEAEAERPEGAAPAG